MIKMIIPLMIGQILTGINANCIRIKSEIISQESAFDINDTYFKSLYGLRPNDMDMGDYLSYVYGIYESSVLNKIQIDTNCDFVEDDRYATLAIKTSNTAIKEKLLENNCYSSVYNDEESGLLHEFKIGEDGWIYSYGEMLSQYVTLPISVSELSSSDKMIVEMYHGEYIARDAIYVEDAFAPTIVDVPNERFTRSYAKKLSKEEIFKGIVAYDNYAFEVDYEVVNYDAYLQNYKIGEIELLCYAVDSSDNRAYFKVNINQIDDIAPAIEGPDKIYKGTQKIFTIEEIMETCEVRDISEYEKTYVDGNSNGKKKYLENASRAGDYEVRVMATDKYNNTGTKKIEIGVYEELAPVVYYGNRVLVDSNVKLELEDFINLMKASGEVDTGLTNQFQVVEDSYSEYFSIEGTSKYSIKVRTSNGNSFVKDFEVSVNKVNYEYEDVYKKTFIDEIEDFFKGIGKWFWKNIFRPIARLFGYKGR